MRFSNNLNMNADLFFTVQQELTFTRDTIPLHNADLGHVFDDGKISFKMASLTVQKQNLICHSKILISNNNYLG